MNRSSLSRAFTLIEMLTVMAVIAILAGLILSINGLVQRKAATAKAQADIAAMSAACENYKADNGSYPSNTDTDTLDPRKTGTPASYQAASKYLYIALSGDTNANGQFEDGEGKNYAPDFWRPERLGGTKNSSGQMTTVTFIMDPFGNSYGYSTKGAADELEYRNELRTNPSAQRPDAGGYSSTFDLWSTTGKTQAPSVGDPKDVTNVWVKSWGN